MILIFNVSLLTNCRQMLNWKTTFYRSMTPTFSHDVHWIAWNWNWLGQSSYIYGRLDLGLLPINFQTQRMGFILQHLQCKQKNLKHFSEESDTVCIIEIGEGPCERKLKLMQSRNNILTIRCLTKKHYEMVWMDSQGGSALWRWIHSNDVVAQHVLSMKQNIDRITTEIHIMSVTNNLVFQPFKPPHQLHHTSTLHSTHRIYTTEYILSQSDGQYVGQMVGRSVMTTCTETSGLLTIIASDEYK